MEDIDLVVPYVDDSDPHWQWLFNKFNPSEEKVEAINATCRFRSQGDFFKYFFRCIDKNMPWIHTVHFIVQSESQIPSWLDRNKVHIVYHSDFIPYTFLPVFNSTAIEMFLWNIPELSNKFLYANDDTFVIRPVSPEDYYTDNNLPIGHTIVTKGDTMFTHHKINACALLANMSKEEWLRHNTFVPGMTHQIRPYRKDLVLQCYNNYTPQILSSITPFRDRKNYNIFLFDYFNIKNKNFLVNKSIFNCCVSFKTKRPMIVRTLNLPKVQSVCIQDSFEENVYDIPEITDFFLNTFPDKSKYEK